VLIVVAATAQDGTVGMEELSKLSVRELKGRLMAHGVSEDEVHTYKEKPDLVQACLEHEQRQAGAKAKTQRTKMSRVHAFALASLLALFFNLRNESETGLLDMLKELCRQQLFGLHCWVTRRRFEFKTCARHLTSRRVSILLSAVVLSVVIDVVAAITFLALIAHTGSILLFPGQDVSGFFKPFYSMFPSVPLNTPFRGRRAINKPLKGMKPQDVDEAARQVSGIMKGFMSGGGSETPGFDAGPLVGLFVVKKVQYRLDKWVLEALADIDATTALEEMRRAKKVAEKGEDSKNDDTETETCPELVRVPTAESGEASNKTEGSTKPPKSI
jgi:hypothetical protein